MLESGRRYDFERLAGFRPRPKAYMPKTKDIAFSRFLLASDRQVSRQDQVSFYA